MYWHCYHRRGEKNAFLPDKNSTVILPKGSTFGDLVDRMIAIIREADDEQKKTK